MLGDEVTEAALRGFLTALGWDENRIAVEINVGREMRANGTYDEGADELWRRGLARHVNLREREQS